MPSHQARREPLPPGYQFGDGQAAIRCPICRQTRVPSDGNLYFANCAHCGAMLRLGADGYPTPIQ